MSQMANLMAEWLILAGAEINEVQLQVENHLHDMILKTFDPKKADAIFAEGSETPSWLAELIEYPTWRSLIYRLAQETMVVFAIISLKLSIPLKLLF